MVFFYLQAILTWLLTGLIWTIQVAHYPMFKFIIEQPKAFTFHQQRISIVVIPLMLLELITGLYLLIYYWPLFKSITMLNTTLLFIIWCHTFLIMVPLHRSLETAADSNTVDRLINQNWIRTLAWTVKSLLWGGALWHHISIY
jgi:hypothetical protein